MNDPEYKSIISDISHYLWKWHKTGHIHGDIKPENIMYGNKDNKWKPIGYNYRYYIGTNRYKQSNDVYDTLICSPPDFASKSLNLN